MDYDSDNDEEFARIVERTRAINFIRGLLGYDLPNLGYNLRQARVQAYLNTRRTSRRKQNRVENNYANN